MGRRRQVWPNPAEARKVIDDLWSTVTEEEQLEIDDEIDLLIHSKFVGIRFSLLTQLVGKATDPKLDCLCLQKGKTGDESCWDPRTFAQRAIVPWMDEYESVLGKSRDPYVSNPLRKNRLEEKPSKVKSKQEEKEWILLYKVLHEVQKRNSEDFTQERLLATLRSIHKLLSGLRFEYYVPERVSINQTQKAIDEFLSESSGGDRGLSIVAALFQTFGKFFHIYKEVRRYVINASDTSTGLSGDIECIGSDDEIKLAIEVKERNLALTDVRSAILKARKFSLRELLFNTPGTDPTQENEIKDLIDKTWASGLNVYRLSIDELMKAGLSIIGEEGRKDFLVNIGKQLDTYNTQPANRKRWKDILQAI